MSSNNIFSDITLYENLIQIPTSVIYTCFIIILLTTGVSDENSVFALISGYSGILIGIIFIIVLNMPITKYLYIFPFIFIMILVSLELALLIKYWNRISNGQVSSYYKSFSNMFVFFLAIQMSTLMYHLSNKKMDKMDISYKTICLLHTFSVINFFIIIIIGIVLRYYYTQG